MADNNNAGDTQDPALKGFSRIGFEIKHVAGKLLTGGLTGALIGGAIALAAVAALTVLIPGGAIAAGLAALAAPLVPALGSLIGGGLLHTAIIGAVVGGGLGAVIGGGTAAAGAGDAADSEEQRLITKSEQTDMRMQRMQTLQQQRQLQSAAMQQQAMAMGGANPNQGLPNLGGSDQAMSA